MFTVEEIVVIQSYPDFISREQLITQLDKDFPEDQVDVNVAKLVKSLIKKLMSIDDPYFLELDTNNILL